MKTIVGEMQVNTTMRASEIARAWERGSRGGHKLVFVRPLDVDSEKVGLYLVRVAYTAAVKVSVDDIGQRSEIVFGQRQAVKKVESWS